MNKLHFTRYWILLFFSLPFLLFSKTPKPSLLVYGSNMEAYVAALQAAASGVPTLWVNPQSYTCEQDRFGLKDNSEGKKLDGGVVTQFITNKEGQADSVNNFFQNGKKQSYSVLSKDNLFLTVVNSEDIVKIEQGKSWKFTLTNKKSYDVRVVLDASEGNILVKKTKLGNLPALNFIKSKDLDIAKARSIALITEFYNDIYVSGLTDLFTQKENFFVVDSKAFPAEINKSYLLSYAQVMGAIAGYCTFFKTTVDKVDLRTFQNELLMFRGRLLPTLDVSYGDKNFMSLQRMFLTGILPLRVQDDGLHFDFSDSVRVADIKPIINQFYSRAQLWFVDNNPEYLTVQDALNLIKYTSFRGEELDVEVKRKWNKDFTFKADYDSSKIISRYEFAVLFDLYASPFVKKVSQDGKTILR